MFLVCFVFLDDIRGKTVLHFCALAERDELACSYAALILHDDGIAITAEKIKKIVAAAGITDLQPYWPALFERVLKGKNIDDMILNAGGAGVPSVGGGAAPTAAAAAAAPDSKGADDTKKGGKKGADEKKGEGKKEEKKEEKPKEPEPEEEIALGSFGLFDE
jgi:large subunit ribosomal protein LP1